MLIAGAVVPHAGKSLSCVLQESPLPSASEKSSQESEVNFETCVAMVTIFPESTNHDIHIASSLSRKCLKIWHKFKFMSKDTIFEFH